MSQKLTRALDRYKEIETILASQGASADPETYASLMKEYCSLSEIYEKSEEYSRAEKEIEDLTALLASEDDPALKELCEGELRDAKERLERVQKELNSLLFIF